MLLAAACTPPAIVKKVEPVYLAVGRPGEKTRDVDATIGVSTSPAGTVISDAVDRSTGVPYLDRAALAAVKQWEFASAASCTSFDVTVAFQGIPAQCYAAVTISRLAPTTYEANEGIEGRVDVLVTVDATGKVRATQITGSSGSDAIDKAVIRQAEDSLWVPEWQDCHPVDGGQYTFTFDLQ